MGERIAEWLPLFFEPTDVLELRALDAGRPGRKLAAYLRASDIPAKAHLIAAAAEHTSGMYFTPQVLDPACLGRFAHLNLLVEVNRHHKLTADADVVARRYVLIDVDPVRPTKTNATEAEKEAARQVAQSVREYLTAHEWPEPLEVDSGNGVHLYYRSPEPIAGGPSDSQTDPVAQLLRCLAKRCDTAAATIDTSVWNSSRIMKVPGTVARKGAAMPERPHRECRVVNVPTDWSRTT